MVLGDPALREEVAKLQASAHDLADELRRREEDLEGARRANRELMAELNRSRPAP